MDAMSSAPNNISTCRWKSRCLVATMIGTPLITSIQQRIAVLCFHNSIICDKYTGLFKTVLTLSKEEIGHTSLSDLVPMELVPKWGCGLSLVPL